MERTIEEVQDLKKFCANVGSFREGAVTLFLLEQLRLPDGCNPPICDALLCPTARDSYPTRLYLSAKVTSRFTRNWNCENARIGERNWFAFSWTGVAAEGTLAQILVGHLDGFVREK